MSSALSEAVALLQQGQAAAARARLQAAPDEAAEHAFLLGACSHALGDLADALRQFTEALKRNPDHVQSACALGSLYAALGRPELAEALFRQMLERGVEDRQLRFNLAVVLDNRHHLTEAEAIYSALLDADPDDHSARHNRAVVNARQSRLNEAARDYRELIRRQPAHTPAWQNLADIELGLAHYASALDLIREVRQRDSGNAGAMLTEAIALAALARFEESSAVFTALRNWDEALWQSTLARVNGRFGRATDVDPRLIYLLRQHEHRESCDWADIERATEVWQDIDALAEGDLLPLAFRAFATPLSPAAQKKLAQRVAAQTHAGVTPYRHQPRFPGEKLRIGYCSARFGETATGVLLRHFFQYHSAATTQVCLLQLVPSDDSAIARDLRASGVSVVDLSGLDDQAAAARVHALNLDVLVDLGGYGTESRPRLFAYKPAPVQVSWIAHPGTSGAPTIDYILSDAAVSPGGDWCTEAEVLLPRSYLVFSHGEGLPITPRRSLLGLPEDKFVFCCLNASYKIEPETFSIWMQLLKDCPQSVLWLLASSPAAVLNLKREAEQRGVDPRRLLFAPRVSTDEHMARFGAADLFLDTRFCTGHTTSAEALWSGLPVLTCPGENFAGRVSRSLLQACELDELVVQDWEAYRLLAQDLYKDRIRLQRLRQHLAIRRRQAAPFDLVAQARALEKAFFHMRERFITGQKPAPFAVTDL